MKTIPIINPEDLISRIEEFKRLKQYLFCGQNGVKCGNSKAIQHLLFLRDLFIMMEF
jgi:hypothetical protein